MSHDLGLQCCLLPVQGGITRRQGHANLLGRRAAVLTLLPVTSEIIALFRDQGHQQRTKDAGFQCKMGVCPPPPTWANTLVKPFANMVSAHLGAEPFTVQMRSML
eukprot:1142517-Pelagomonas_calceolata.AAC.1